ncbi:MAG: iron uptake transporter permease EfeU [Candidatus Nanopelagicales bacterium]
MFANYLIGLREGLEASLVVGILVAYLVRTGNQARLRSVWLGVALAVGVSLAFGALLTFSSQRMTFQAQEAFGGFLSLIAVGFVTWMVFWMKKAARNLRGELHGRLDDALAVGGTALVVLAFISVAREGLETALFLWTAIQSTTTDTNAWTAVLGAVLGLATAVVLGWLIYRGALRLNLAVFFRWTGAALIVVAAGVLAYGVHDLQEAGILPGLDNLAFDVTSVIVPGTVLATLIKGIFNISPSMTVLEVVVYVAYLVPTMVLYFRSSKPVTVPASPQESADAAAAVQQSVAGQSAPRTPENAG